MRRANKVLVGLSLALLVFGTLQAQDYSEKINANIGAAVSFPVSSTSKLVKSSWGLTGGAGYNFSTHHSVIGEFMWSTLSPSASSIQPIRIASNDNGITGHSNLYALTANYRFQLQRKRLGAYFIGGGGWYYRTMGFSMPVTSGFDTACTPAWVWWGFTCASGTVTANQTVKDNDSSVFGGNAGIGFTITIADPTYSVYIEPRYHYAPTKNLNTRLVEVTVGIRY